jgi:predicted dehydrogenase
MHTSRRTFLKSAAIFSVSAPALIRAQNTNSKLNVACVGIGGRGAASVNGVKEENIVALCDVNRNTLDKAGGQFADARRFADYRELLAELGDKIDAITVATPDHTHAVTSAAAMKRGIHCYTEKPLTHNVAETEYLIHLAAKKNLKTQMGIQIHAEPNYRRVVELIQANAIGTIKDVHVWVSSKPWGNQKIPSGTFEVPAHLDWNLWLGPAAERPYNPCYFGGHWRSFWAFGSGVLGDMACHYMDLPYWALGLREPATIEATGPAVDPESCPLGLTVKYEYPKTAKHDALMLTWYDSFQPPVLKTNGLPDWKNGVLFVGSEGMLLADYSKNILFPEEKFKDFKRPKETIPPSIGHHAEWIKAIKESGTTTCHFDYSGILTEAVLLGTAAYRVGKKLTWKPVTDSKRRGNDRRLQRRPPFRLGDKRENEPALRFQTDCPEANALLSEPQRKGWEL